MLKMGYMVTHGPWLSKQSEIIIHFNIIIKIMKHFLGSVRICGSVRGLFFTRNLHVHPIVPRNREIRCPLDLHRSVLHTDLPAPYCFDCKSAARQERQETTGYIYTLWFQIDKIGMSYLKSKIWFMWSHF